MRIALLLFVLLFPSCTQTVSPPQASPPPSNSTTTPNTGKAKADPYAELNKKSTEWFYGQGVGDTIINVGGIVIFPPYAVVVVGNAVATLAGYQPVGISDALPEEAGKQWKEAYSSVASTPGRVNAALAGKDYYQRPDTKQPPPVIAANNKSPIAPQYPS